MIPYRIRQREFFTMFDDEKFWSYLGQGRYHATTSVYWTRSTRMYFLLPSIFIFNSSSSALKRKRYIWMSICGAFLIMSKMTHSFVWLRKDFILQGSVLSIYFISEFYIFHAEHVYATIYMFMSGLQLMIMVHALYLLAITTGKSVISNNGASCSVVNMHMRMVDYGCTCVMRFPARISVREFAYVHTSRSCKERNVLETFM